MLRCCVSVALGRARKRPGKESGRVMAIIVDKRPDGRKVGPDDLDADDIKALQVEAQSLWDTHGAKKGRGEYGWRLWDYVICRVQEMGFTADHADWDHFLRGFVVGVLGDRWGDQP